MKIGQPVTLRSVNYRNEEQEFQGIVTAVTGTTDKPIYRITYIRFNDYGSNVELVTVPWDPESPAVKVFPATAPFDFGSAFYAAHLDVQDAKENLRRAERTSETLKTLFLSFREAWAKQAVGEFLQMCLGGKDEPEERNTH